MKFAWTLTLRALTGRSVKAMPVANRKLSSDISILFYFTQKKHCFSVVNSLLLIINRCQRVHICTPKIFKEWKKKKKWSNLHCPIWQRYTHMSKKNAVDRDWVWDADIQLELSLKQQQYISELHFLLCGENKVFFCNILSPFFGLYRVKMSDKNWWRMQKCKHMNVEERKRQQKIALQIDEETEKTQEGTLERQWGKQKHPPAPIHKCSGHDFDFPYFLERKQTLRKPQKRCSWDKIITSLFLPRLTPFLV